MGFIQTRVMRRTVSRATLYGVAFNMGFGWRYAVENGGIFVTTDRSIAQNLSEEIEGAQYALAK